jgi:hypothetical protein
LAPRIEIAIEIAIARVIEIEKGRTLGDERLDAYRLSISCGAAMLSRVGGGG